MVYNCAQFAQYERKKQHFCTSSHSLNLFSICHQLSAIFVKFLVVTPQGGYHHLSSSSSPNGKRLRSRGHPRSDLSISTLLPSLCLPFEIPHPIPRIPFDSNPNLSVTVSPTLINGSSTLKPLAVILPLNDNENHLESVPFSIRHLFLRCKKEHGQ